MKDNKKFSSTEMGVEQDTDGLYRYLKQDIPSDFMDQLKEEKNVKGFTKSGEMMKLASIPVVIVEQMKKEGLDVYQASATEIVKWLRNNDMDHFILGSHNRI
tara:strand:+ start:1736 stop:2041 length:306 start_codon:yes stop_codon:yes gene_type:complete